VEGLPPRRRRLRREAGGIDDARGNRALLPAARQPDRALEPLAARPGRRAPAALLHAAALEHTDDRATDRITTRGQLPHSSTYPGGRAAAAPARSRNYPCARSIGTGSATPAISPPTATACGPSRSDDGNRLAATPTASPRSSRPAAMARTMTATRGRTSEPPL
jgi:hypothetical protein